MRERLVAGSALLALAALAACDAGGKGDESAGPRLYVTSPRMDAVVAPPSKPGEPERHVTVSLDLRSYPIGRVEDGGNGQHVHVIVDGEPYLAIYDVSKPVPLPDALMTPGTHVVRAFPSAGPKDPAGAAHHESRKNPGAFAWVRFHVGARDGPLQEFDGTKPLLTYSRPKGDYRVGTPEHDRFLVDWYLTNVTLGLGKASVRATLDGTVVGDWTEWKPQFLSPSPAPGEHTLVLELLDGDGRQVEGPFSRTERTFRVTK